jgi:hypothetical protein
MILLTIEKYQNKLKGRRKFLFSYIFEVSSDIRGAAIFCDNFISLTLLEKG